MLFDPAWKPSRKGGVAPVIGVAGPVSDLGDKKDVQEYVVLDLRDQPTFDQSHIPRSRNLPVDSLDDLNPYRHPPSMVKQYQLLDERLSAKDTEFGTSLEGKIVLTLLI
ncbi:hypothetical protein MPER_09842 [Moniliophthora perniciosa FA553]|nr:hypothetical protein MPER_09842 [Moniliophthora perniciosa FA553]